MSRNFGIASVLFFVFGVTLFGSTTLIPQLLQSLYGYRAIDAGIVLAPGALVISVLAPVSAQLLQRQLVQPRFLVLLSMTIVALAMWHYSGFTLDTDYRHYVLARLPGIRVQFLFRSHQQLARDSPARTPPPAHRGASCRSSNVRCASCLLWIPFASWDA